MVGEKLTPNSNFKFGANAFFKIQDVAVANNMYTTGLHCILVIYNLVLDQFKGSSVNTLRSEFLKRCLIFVRQMSATNHSIPNMLHVLHGFYPDQFNDWDAFINGTDISMVPSLRGKDVSSWIGNDNPEFVSIPSLTPFQKFLGEFSKRFPH